MFSSISQRSSSSWSEDATDVGVSAGPQSSRERMRPRTVPSSNHPIRSASSVVCDRVSTSLARRACGALRLSRDTSTRTNASSNRSARLRSRTSASLNSFSLSTSCRATRRRRRGVAHVAAGDRELPERLLTEGYAPFLPPRRIMRTRRLRESADREPLLQFDEYSVRDDGCRSVGRVHALRQHGSRDLPFQVPAHEVNFAHRRTQALKKRHRSEVCQLRAAARVLPDGDQNEVEKPLRTFGARALDSQEMPECGFVVGQADLSAAKFDTEWDRVERHTRVLGWDQRLERGAPY